MKINIIFGKESYAIDLNSPLDVSIPLKFDGGERLSVFGTPSASMKPFQAGDFIGSVRQGGSVNCEVYTITPHCNGTHTECVGHISTERISVTNVLKDGLIPATLITIEPESVDQISETYDPAFQKEDKIITRYALEKALGRMNTDFIQGLLIRTLPNNPDKITRNYDQNPPPFFSREAMEYIAKLGVKHLLVDMPSVDRLMDEGKLTNHHTFWGVEYGSHDVDPASPSPKTITELIYVPSNVHDGHYLLNLQIAPFAADAAPSRPILYEALKP